MKKQHNQNFYHFFLLSLSFLTKEKVRANFFLQINKAKSSTVYLFVCLFFVYLLWDFLLKKQTLKLCITTEKRQIGKIERLKNEKKLSLFGFWFLFVLCLFSTVIFCTQRTQRLQNRWIIRSVKKVTTEMNTKKRFRKITVKNKMPNRSASDSVLSNDLSIRTISSEVFQQCA